MPYKPRLPGRTTFINASEQYSDIFYRKKIGFIRQLTTPKFTPNIDPTTIRSVRHIWTTGDKYYKLAVTYYNDASLWWVIAKFNNKPTEGHLKLGDQVLIPLPLSQVLRSS
jgi:hypothetical protein|tara:strand:- start:2187 stop:2519 length:333 start_codon:yes stop_codon:yes gene_type:complete